MSEIQILKEELVENMMLCLLARSNDQDTSGFLIIHHKLWDEAERLKITRFIAKDIFNSFFNLLKNH